MKILIYLVLAAAPALAQFGNATSLRGKSICSPLTATDTQVLSWDATNSCWKAATGSAVNFTGSLVGDVTGTQGATVLSAGSATNLNSGTLNAARLPATAVQNADSGRNLPNLSLGTGYLSTGKTAGTGGTTAGLLVKLDTDATVITAATSDTGILGVAISTVAAAATTEVAVRGLVSCVADNTTVIADLVGVGTSTAGRCRGLGTASVAAVSPLVQIVGRALAVATVGNSFNLQLFGPGHYGANTVLDPGANGFMDRTAANTASARTLTAGAHLAVTNGGGGGNPVFSFDNYCLASGGTSAAFACTMGGVVATTPATGTIVNFVPNANSTTTTPTLAVNGGTAKTIVRLGNSALNSGELGSGNPHLLYYDGTSWRLLGPGWTSTGVAQFPSSVTLNGTGTLTAVAGIFTGALRSDVRMVMTPAALSCTSGAPGTVTITATQSILKISLASDGSACSITWAAGTTGQVANLLFCHGATAVTSFTWPSGVKGGMAAAGAANTCQAQSFFYDGAGAAWYATSTGASGM